MRSVGFEERVLHELAYPRGEVPLVTRARGTLLASSTQGVRERGLQQEYFEALDPRYHEAIRGLVPGTWLPVELAAAHYAAIDTLGLAPEQQWDMGRRVAERVQHSWVGTVIRGLKASGAVTPVQVLTRFQNAWDRLFEGGGSEVVQTAPKDIRVEAHGMHLAPGAYFKNAWCGMFESTLELVAKKVYVRQLARYEGPTTCAFDISWV